MRLVYINKKKYKLVNAVKHKVDENIHHIEIKGIHRSPIDNNELTLSFSKNKNYKAIIENISWIDEFGENPVTSLRVKIED